MTPSNATTPPPSAGFKRLVAKLEKAGQRFYAHAANQALVILAAATHDLTKWEAYGSGVLVFALTAAAAKVKKWAAANA